MRNGWLQALFLHRMEHQVVHLIAAAVFLAGRETTHGVDGKKVAVACRAQTAVTSTQTSCSLLTRSSHSRVKSSRAHAGRARRR